MTMTTPDTAGLAALEERLKQDLAWLELPAKSWVPRRVVDGETVVDVVIIGAGMAGLVASAMLKRLGVDNQLVLDRARAGAAASCERCGDDLVGQFGDGPGP